MVSLTDIHVHTFATRVHTFATREQDHWHWIKDTCKHVYPSNACGTEAYYILQHIPV